MINLQDAIDIFNSNKPDCKIISAMEYPNMFLFAWIPNDANEESWTNMPMLISKKDGKVTYEMPIGKGKGTKIDLSEIKHSDYTLNNKQKEVKNVKIYKTTQGRYINDNKEWVWNGESYDYVLSHPDWLPLVFKSDSDAKKFERLEKEYKAELDSKSGNKQLAAQAKTWLRNNSSTQVARHSDVYVYGQNYLMHHGIKGQKWGVENGPPYPLNDTVKAIAYRGGLLGDGRKAVGFTKRDVKKARKIVNKNLKTMTSEEIQEYRARLALESQMGEMLGTNSGEKLRKQIKDNAIQAVGNSIKSTGTTVLTNLEMKTVESFVTNMFGPEVAAMITDGITTWQKDHPKQGGGNQNQQQNNQQNNNQNQQNQQKKPNQNNSNYEHVKGETVNNNSNDHKYEDKEKVNGEWRYYYEEPQSVRYESWNSPYLLPGSTSSTDKKSKKKRR